MIIQTYTACVGGRICNAHCPYCISKMTPEQGIELKAPTINWRNFRIGCKLSRDNNASTVLLTGKGEPTLFPEQVTEFLKNLQPHGFSFIELQTNGMILLQKKGKKLNELMHGAEVYDVNGQNICFSTCLTLDPSRKELRQLIFFPDGHLRYDWQYPGAILL